MVWWMSVAVAGPTTVLVGVGEQKPVNLGGQVTACFASSQVCLVEGSSPEALAALPGVRYAEWDRPMAQASGGTVTPTAQCPDPHELLSIDVEGAWTQVCGLEAPVVAVQDSGFLATHVDLLGRVVSGWDYGDNDGNPEVTWQSGVPEHGTFIAGIVAANDDGSGRTGVAPEASLFLQKIADRTGGLYFSYAIAAMDDLATAHPEVRVLNYSIASTDPPQAFQDAVSALGDADILVITAAANCGAPDCFDADNDRYPVYPANYRMPHVVAVASQRQNGTLDPYSHFGAQTVPLAAPGADICSLGVASDTEMLVASGTSYATPVVAGVAALVREAWPRLDAGQVAEVLCRSAARTASLADRVACGAVQANVAVNTPVALVTSVPDVVFDSTGTLVVEIDSLAAAGQAELAIVLPPFVALEGDATVALPADGRVTVEIPLRATGPTTGMGQVTLVVPGLASLAVPFSVVATLAAEVPSETATTPATVPEADPPGGCGCRSANGGGALFVGGLLMLSRRRRGRSHRR